MLLHYRLHYLCIRFSAFLLSAISLHYVHYFVLALHLIVCITCVTIVLLHSFAFLHSVIHFFLGLSNIALHCITLHYIALFLLYNPFCITDASALLLHYRLHHLCIRLCAILLGTISHYVHYFALALHLHDLRHHCTATFLRIFAFVIHFFFGTE